MREKTEKPLAACHPAVCVFVCGREGDTSSGGFTNPLMWCSHGADAPAYFLPPSIFRLTNTVLDVAHTHITTTIYFLPFRVSHATVLHRNELSLFFHILDT